MCSTNCGREEEGEGGGLCNMARTLVEEGDAIVGEERLELHGLRSATAAVSAFVFPLRSEFFFPPLGTGDCARISKGFALSWRVFFFFFWYTWAFFGIYSKEAYYEMSAQGP